jgi:hypothetical protein
MKFIQRWKMLLAGVLAISLVGGLALAGEKADKQEYLPAWFQKGLYIGPYLSNTGSVDAVAANKITRTHGQSAVIDFASTTVGEVDSTAMTVTGAQLGDACSVGSSAALTTNGTFTCFVSAADAVKVRFQPRASSNGTTAALDGASPSVATATVLASSKCTCSNVGTTAAIAAAGCAVSLSGTTLTITSLNGGTHTVNYDCKAPVDPASATFYVRTFSQQ